MNLIFSLQACDYHTWVVIAFECEQERRIYILDRFVQCRTKGSNITLGLRIQAGANGKLCHRSEGLALCRGSDIARVN